MTGVTEELVEPLPEPTPPLTTREPVEHTPEISRKNMLWGWALFGLFCVLFGGSVAVAFIYLWLD